jgi:hypothetical protein
MGCGWRRISCSFLEKSTSDPLLLAGSNLISQFTKWPTAWLLRRRPTLYSDLSSVLPLFPVVRTSLVTWSVLVATKEWRSVIELLTGWERATNSVPAERQDCEESLGTHL